MPARSTPAAVEIARPSQLGALVSPIRQEIVDAISAAGPSTMAQIAEWLGRPADTLYYHVAALRRVGLLVESGRRRTGRRFGAVYDVPGRPLLMRPKGSKAPQAIRSVVRAALRLADRDLKRSLEAGLVGRGGADGAFGAASGTASGGASGHAPSMGAAGDGRAPTPCFEGPERNVWAGRTKGWVTAADLRRIASLMDEIVAIVGRGAPRPGAHAQSFTFVLAPVVSRPARRGAHAAAGDRTSASTPRRATARRSSPEASTPKGARR